MAQQFQDEGTTPADGQVTRRTVIRTAARAAWAVPLITAVSAAPAYAASGPASLSVTSVAWVQPNPNHAQFVDIDVYVTNNGPGDLTGVVVSFTNFSPSYTYSDASLQGSPDWSGPSGGLPPNTLTATYSRSHIPAGATRQVRLRLWFGKKSGPVDGQGVTVSGVVSGANVAPVPFSAADTNDGGRPQKP